MRRDNCFDFLRLFAALTVVIQHSTIHLGTSFLWLKPHGRFWFYDGVPMFFVMSGFLVFRSGEQCISRGLPVRNFFINRALRIIPALYAYLTVSVVLLWSLLNPKELTAFIGSTLALVPVYNPQSLRSIGVGVWNGSLWTIPAEVSFYVIVPLLAFAFLRMNKRPFIVLIATLFIACSAIGIIVDSRFSGTISAKLYQITFLWGFPFFGMGIIWSVTWERFKHPGWMAVLSSAIYLALTLWVRPDYLHGLWVYFVSAIPLSYATIWFANYGPRILSALTRRIGDLSYGVYIWHMVLINLMLRFNAPKSHLLALVATIGIASLSWWFIERPALKLKSFSLRSSPKQQVITI